MGRFRHKLIWSVLRMPVALFLKIKFNFTGERAAKINGPFLLISNHVTNYDPLMIACSFKQQMYFVSSEHLFRKGLITKLLVWLVAPIARIKGSTDTVSAMNIIRALRHQSNVGLFAEGDRSWNGCTNRLHQTTARLIRASKASLVTYRLTGGYFSSPRWSATIRRGKMTGRLINVFKPEQLTTMTDEELTAIIMADIGEDAYAQQRRTPISYRGKKRAEDLEMAIYTCPVCSGVGTTYSCGNEFFCRCGLSMTYNEYGHFEGAARPFETIAEWDEWQEGFLQALAPQLGDAPIFRDEGQTLWRIDHNHAETLTAQGTLVLYSDRLELGEFTVPLKKIYQMSVYGAGTIVFSAEGANYEIKSSIRRSGRKYLTMYGILTSLADKARSTTANIG